MDNYMIYDPLDGDHQHADTLKAAQLEAKNMIQGILDANTAQVEQFRAADEDKQKKMIGFFVGQVMKASQGKANPGMVNPILAKMLKG